MAGLAQRVTRATHHLVVLALAILLLVPAQALTARAAENPVSVVLPSLQVPTAFSPNGDGQEDVLDVYYCLSRAANVDVVVRDSTDTAVRTLESGVSHQGGASCDPFFGWSDYLEWDGRDDHGQVVPDGDYSIAIHAVDSDNNTADASYQTAVDSRAPGQITQPAPNATLSGTATVVFTPTAGFTIVQFNAGCPGASGSATSPAGDGTFHVNVDTTGCSNGTSTISGTVYYIDEFGQSHSWTPPTVPVSIANTLPPVTISTFVGLSRVFSPNGDGQEDTIPLGYCLSRDANVDVVVRDSTSTAVRTLESGVSRQGADCLPFGWSDLFEWDGRDDHGQVVPDGDYSIAIHAVDSDNNTADASYQTAVDSRAPGQITQPAPNATLSGTATVVFTPTAGFTIVQFNAGCPGASGSATSPAGDGTFHVNVDTTGCSNGTSTISGTVYYIDEFGQSHSWTPPTVPVSIANTLPPVTISTFVGLSRVFSPNGDGQEDTIPLGYCLSRDANVDVVVRDSTSTAVRTLESGVSRQGANCLPFGWSDLFEWDGRDDHGQVVPDGDYSIAIHAVDSDNNTADLAIPTAVDSRAPGQITQPAPNATLSGTATVVFTPTAGFTIVQFNAGCPGASGSATSPAGDGTFHVNVDTTGCSNGTSTISGTVYYIDEFGQSHSWTPPTVPVSIANTLPPVTISTFVGLSRVFSPNGDGQEDTIPLGYCLSRDANVDVVVRDSTSTAVRTLESGVSRQGANCLPFGWSDLFEWDGRDDHGQVVPDGDYSIAIHAVDSDNNTADLAIPTAVDTRAPGQITQPAPNATLAGLARFVFTPTAGVDVAQVQGCFSTGGCVTMYNPSPDGLWRTSIFTGQLHQGPAMFSWTTYFGDEFGQTHTWNGPPISVSIDTTSLPLDATVDPTSGQAPLAADFTITASEPHGNPLSYTISFGDSTSTSGTITAPYDPLDIPHTYAVAGVYAAHVSVSNDTGGFAQQTLTITVTAPPNHAPTASLTMTPSSGVVPLDTSATIDASDQDGDPLTYTLDFGDGTAAQSGQLPVAPVAHEYAHAGSFTVRLAVSDGQEQTVKTANVNIGLAEPLAAHAGDDQQGIVSQQLSFDGSASRPLIGIDSYTWDFGDGTPTATGAHVTHTFTTTGQFAVSLSVKSGISSSTDTLVANVSAIPTEPGAHITVTDADSAAISGADVLVIDGGGLRYSATTDSSGVATLNGLPDGSFTAYASHDGYQPGTGSVTVANGTGSATIVLQAGSIAQTSLTADRLTPDQIVAAGIDPNDPDNQNIYQFEIHLAFVADGTTSDLTFGGYSSSGGGGGGGGGGGAFFLQPAFGGDATPCPAGASCATVGGYTAYPTVQYVNNEPSVLWMVIPGKAKWLKEFFDVHLLVSNLAAPAFTLEHGHVSLGQLPDGLSLAPTATPQSLEQDLPDIAGGTSQEADWIVRGDTEGYYTLTANFTGTLEPLGVSVSLPASTATNALHVWGGSALEMIVDADDVASDTYPYLVRVGLKNHADTPVFNPSIELLKQGKLNYLYQPQERLEQGTDSIQPGATFWTDYYRLIPSISGDLDLAQSFVKKTAGNVDLASTIISHPVSEPRRTLTATPLYHKVGLQWDPIPGATGYEIFATPDRKTDFPSQALSVRMVGTTQAVVDNVPVGQDTWYAVSAVVDGRPTLYHSIAEGWSLNYAPSPVTTATYLEGGPHACGKDVSIAFDFSEDFFQLSHYRITVSGASDILGDLTGKSGTAQLDLPQAQIGNGVLQVTAAAQNSDGDWGPTWIASIDEKCQRRHVVVLAAGLSSFLSDSGLDSYNNGQPFGGEHATFGSANNPDSILGVLNGLGYSYDPNRQDPNRTVLEFHYRGDSPINETQTPNGPVFDPGTYRPDDTMKELQALGRDDTTTAAEYLDALEKYEADWFEVHHEHLTFDFIGHSEGGYESLAVARRAQMRGERDLIGNVITVDGAVNPLAVLNDINVGSCFEGITTGSLAADLAGLGGFSRIVSATLGAAKARGSVQTIDQVNQLYDFGVKVVNITNTADTCLSDASTLVRGSKAIVVPVTADVAGPGSVDHGALLFAQPNPGFPLSDFIKTYIGKPLQDTDHALRSDSLTGDAAGLTGVLLDSGGNPINQAQVFAYGSSGPVLSDADSNGNFTISGLVPGDYKLYYVPFTPGHAAGWVGGLDEASARTFSVGTRLTYVGAIVTSNTYTVTAHLTSGGQPATDGAVVLTTPAGAVVGSALADSNGVASLSNVPAGQYGLAAGGQSEVQHEQALTVAADTSVDVSLQGAASIGVRVIDSSGDAIPGIIAVAHQGTTSLAAGMTDTSGLWQFGGLAAGPYSISLYDISGRFTLPPISLDVAAIVGNPDAGIGTYVLVAGEPAIVPGAASVLEGNSGTTEVNVPVTLSSPSTQTVTAQWRTVFVSGAPAGQADPATDYTPASGTVTFAPGETTQTVSISVNGDTLVEPDEYIVVQFGNPTNAKMGGFWGLGFGGITNDDHATVVPGAASVPEGNSGTTEVNVPVTLSSPSTQTVTAQWRTVFVSGAPAGQADPATDYTPASGTVTFAPGETTQTVSISVNGDTLVEPDEYIVVVFGNPTNAKMGGFWGLGFGGITNDDSP